MTENEILVVTIINKYSLNDSTLAVIIYIMVSYLSLSGAYYLWTLANFSIIIHDFSLLP